MEIDDDTFNNNFEDVISCNKRIESNCFCYIVEKLLGEIISFYVDEQFKIFLPRIYFDYLHLLSKCHRLEYKNLTNKLTQQEIISNVTYA